MSVSRKAIFSKVVNVKIVILFVHRASNLKQIVLNVLNNLHLLIASAPLVLAFFNHSKGYEFITPQCIACPYDC